jgi:type II secretory pathway pseudopilin PulG
MENFMKYFKAAIEKFTALALSKRIVIVLVAIIFLFVIIIFINPPKKLAEMRNSTRRTDVMLIVNAAYQYNKDNNGKILEIITEEPKTICNSDGTACENLVDLSEMVAGKKYIKKIPTDPKEKTPGSSGYQIFKTASGRISVLAPNAERGAIINSSK